MSPRRPSDRVAVIARTITLAALWQHEAIDQMRPITDATSLAGTANGSRLTAALRALMAILSLAARDCVTLNRKADRSTMVPRTLMA